MSREVWSALGTPTVNVTFRVSVALTKQRPLPATLLGPGHPFVRDVERLASAARACAVVSAMLIGATSAVALGIGSALPIVFAAAIADVLLLGWSALLVDSRRGHALDLIAHGHEDLPIPAVERRAAELSRPRHRQRLIRSVEALVDPGLRPFDVATVPWQFRPDDLVNPVRRDLREIARLLENPHAGVQGVAVMTHLLRSGTSSLHGGDVGVLRQELARARFLLDARAPVHPRCEALTAEQPAQLTDAQR